MTNYNIGDTIRRHRLANNLSQSDVGMRSGFTAQYISKLESNSCTVSIQTLELVANALGISIHTIINEAKCNFSPAPTIDTICDYLNQTSEKEQQFFIQIFLFLNNLISEMDLNMAGEDD